MSMIEDEERVTALAAAVDGARSNDAEQIAKAKLKAELNTRCDEALWRLVGEPSETVSSTAFYLLKEREYEADKPIRQLTRRASNDADKLAADMKADLNDGITPILLNADARQTNEALKGLQSRGFTVETLGRGLNGSGVLQVTACDNDQIQPTTNPHWKQSPAPEEPDEAKPEPEHAGEADAFEKALRAQGIEVERVKCLADGSVVARVKGRPTRTTIAAGTTP